jgi:hypothetical protein
MGSFPLFELSVVFTARLLHFGRFGVTSTGEIKVGKFSAYWNIIKCENVILEIIKGQVYISGV